MALKHHFIITRYCPKEIIFDGDMTFTEARKFMDQHASYERRVGFKVFNELTCKWDEFRNVAFHGGRKVYDNGCLYIIDPDYNDMWKAESQQWHLWCITKDMRRIFCQSFEKKELADKRCDFLQVWNNDGKYVVEPSDIDISNL